VGFAREGKKRERETGVKEGFHGGLATTRASKMPDTNARAKTADSEAIFPYTGTASHHSPGPPQKKKPKRTHA